MTQTCQIGLYLFFIALFLLSTNNTCSAFGAESSPRQQITEVHCTLTSLPRSHGERFLPYLEIASPQESCARVGQLTAQGHAVRSRGWAGCPSTVPNSSTSLQYLFSVNTEERIHTHIFWTHRVIHEWSLLLQARKSQIKTKQAVNLLLS